MAAGAGTGAEAAAAAVAVAEAEAEAVAVTVAVTVGGRGGEAGDVVLRFNCQFQQRTIYAPKAQPPATVTLLQ